MREERHVCVCGRVTVIGVVWCLRVRARAVCALCVRVFMQRGVPCRALLTFSPLPGVRSVPFLRACVRACV